MRASRANAIAGKCLRELFREPLLIVFALAISPFFLCLDYVGYSREPRPAPRTVLMADAAAAALEPALRAARFADGRPSLRIREAPPGAVPSWIDRELRERRADIAFVPPSAGGGGFEFATRGDATAAGYLAASSLVAAALAAPSDGDLRIEAVDARVLGPRSDFDGAVPGQVAFCALMMTPLAAFLASREIRKGGMARLAASPLGPAEYQAGIQAALLAFCLAAGASTLALAAAMGFSGAGPSPGAAPLAASALVLALCGISSVSVGLAMAPFCSSDSAAINAGFAATMLQVILSGAFFPMPSPGWIELGGMSLGPLDLLPGGPAVKALGQALIGGAGIGTILPRLAHLAVLTALYSGAASIAFSRRTFSPRS
jgi:hypothetical protein